MHPRQSLPPQVHATIARQAGVITAAQLLDAGLTRAVIDRFARGWTRVSQGIFVTSPPSFETAAWAGLLRGGRDSVVGSQAGAYLHKLTRDEPETVTIWAPGARPDFEVGDWQVRFRIGERRSMATPPRTTVEATLLDAASDVKEDEIISLLACAFAEKRTTPQRILAALKLRTRCAHRAVIEAMCQHGAQGIESALEWRFHTSVLKPHGLPIPERQVRTGSGRLDNLYREQRLIIELDGMRDHAGNWSDDMLRDNEHVLTDDRLTLRYGWRSVVWKGCVAAAQVARGLTKFGWPGQMGRCRTCPELEPGEASASLDTPSG